LAAREHRGQMIKQIIDESLTTKTVKQVIGNEKINLAVLKEKNISYSILIPTETGLNKGIMDAVSGVREFLRINNIHDYDSQKFGPDNKVKLIGKFCNRDKDIQTEISLYRSNGRGDYRIWYSELKTFVNANEEIALIYKDDIINVLNLSRIDYSKVL